MSTNGYAKGRPYHPCSGTTFPTHYEESIGVGNKLKLHCFFLKKVISPNKRWIPFSSLRITPYFTSQGNFAKAVRGSFKEHLSNGSERSSSETGLPSSPQWASRRKFLCWNPVYNCLSRHVLIIWLLEAYELFQGWDLCSLVCAWNTLNLSKLCGEGKHTRTPQKDTESNITGKKIKLERLNCGVTVSC